ncbi:phosphodiester glycosidase family protein [Ferruginibacter sp. SUN106]|uniref:phosphodiester glycosidase family protein n=1 Tax=Ferruginibacter sp. SUN106 TaxID=2978348 RepID=UPI003D36D910
MVKTKIYLLTFILLFSATILFYCSNKKIITDANFITYIVDAQKQNIKLYWKDEANKNFSSIQNLNQWVEKNNQKLLFAMNGGMYTTDGSPQGLYIENEKLLSPLDTASGDGNFYLKPNGVFYITTDNIAGICSSLNFIGKEKIKYATQSGPLLLIDGEIHPAFQQGSPNVNTRNGVGILPDNKIVFILSKKPVSFFDFAKYFKSLGCTNALYLDGLVSRAYLPEQNWIQTDGNFGVMIGVTENIN